MDFPDLGDLAFTYYVNVEEDFAHVSEKWIQFLNSFFKPPYALGQLVSQSVSWSIIHLLNYLLWFLLLLINYYLMYCVAVVLDYVWMDIWLTGVEYGSESVFTVSNMTCANMTQLNSMHAMLTQGSTLSLSNTTSLLLQTCGTLPDINVTSTQKLCMNCNTEQCYRPQAGILVVFHNLASLRDSLHRAIYLQIFSSNDHQLCYFVSGLH